MNRTDATSRKAATRIASGSFLGARLRVAFLLAAASVVGAACGGDSAEPAGLTCGPGTTANGGSCTPACGTGTTFDQTTKTCVAVGGSGGGAGAGGSAQAGAAGAAGAAGFPEGHPCGPVPGAKRIINCNSKCGTLDAECEKFQCTANNVDQIELKASHIPLAVRLGGPLPAPTCKMWGICSLPGVTPERIMILPFLLPAGSDSLVGHSTSPDWVGSMLGEQPKFVGFESCAPYGTVCWDKSIAGPAKKGMLIEPTTQQPGDAVVVLDSVPCE